MLEFVKKSLYEIQTLTLEIAKKLYTSRKEEKPPRK
jgi:hypothetical protein